MFAGWGAVDSRFRGNDGGKFLVLLESRFSEHGVHGMCLGLRKATAFFHS